MRERGLHAPNKTGAIDLVCHPRDWRRHTVLEGLPAARVIGEGIDGYRQALGVLAERRDG